MHARITVQVAKDSGRTTVFVKGLINEEADLSALTSLSGELEINLKGITRFNSAGIRDWIDALATLSRAARFVFVECSPAVIQQVNQIHGFLAQAPIRSFYAPLSCPACGKEFDRLFEVAACTAGLPAVDCPECHQLAELDELEAQYLLFLQEPR